MKRATANPKTQVTIDGKPIPDNPGDASEFAKRSRITQVLPDKMDERTSIDASSEDALRALLKPRSSHPQ